MGDVLRGSGLPSSKIGGFADEDIFYIPYCLHIAERKSECLAGMKEAIPIHRL